MIRRHLRPQPVRAMGQRQQRGAMLIEALVVILIFSFGLLAVVGLQAKATQIAVGSEDSNRAALLANEIAAEMWAQRSVTVDADKLTAWEEKVASPTEGGLPNGVGDVTVDGTVARITISWKHPGADANSPDNVYSTDVVVN